MTADLIGDLQKARDIIARGGFIKGGFSDPKGHCTVGALMEVIRPGWASLGMILESEQMTRAVEALASRLPAPSTHPLREQLYDFNDAEETTQDEVVALFDAAIAHVRTAK